MFERSGLAYNPPAEIVPNSRAALRLTELARGLGRHRATHDRLMDAYWEEGTNIGDLGVLRAIAAELELPAEDVERVLEGDDYLDRVQASTQQAVSIGATGVPAFILGGRLLILGAQPRDVFEQAFRQLAD